jgi:transcriptional regulator GlxA family with amidase domain
MIELSANMKIELSNHFSDDGVAPGRLDVLIVPGMDPRETWHEDVLSWLRQQGASPGTDVLSVCTGIYLCGRAGLVDGRRVCGPRGLQSELREMYPKAEFVGEELRWVRDGNFWSSGGVTNGNDLVAAYLRDSGRFPGQVAEFACEVAEVGDRPQLYSRSERV